MTKLHSSNLAKMAGKVDENSLAKLRESYRSSRWVRNVVRPLLQAALVIALMVGMLAVIRTVTEDSRWMQLVPLLLLIVLESIYTTNWIKHPKRLSLDRSAYRAAELLLLVIIVRLGTWMVFDGGFPDREQLLFYMGSPLSFFLNGPFLVTLVLVLIAWRLASLLSDIFIQLDVSEFELRYYTLPLALRKARSDDQPIYTSRHQLVLRFAQFWLWGGIILVVAVGLSTLDIRSLEALKNPLAIGRLGLSPGLLITLLIYFGVGFFLLSQAKLMEMNSRWLLNDIKKDEQMQKTWQRSSLVILLVIGLIAAFMPIGPNLAVGQILTALLYIIFFLVNIFLFIISLPLILLFSLFPGAAEAPPPLAPINPQELQELVPPQSSAFGEMVSLILSSAFWAVFVFIAALALLYFLRERRKGIQGGSPSEIWSRFLIWLVALWTNFWQRLGNVNWQLPRLMPTRERDQQPEPGQQRRFRFIRLGALSPREQIRYFYLSTVRRAGEKGVKRKAARTPLEFVDDLKDGWPVVEEEVEDLTEAFLKARYSAEPITKDDLPEVKETWKDVRRELKQRSLKPEDSEPD